MAVKIVSPGRIISKNELRTLAGTEIERRFKDRSSTTIPARGVAPFMVVFSKVSNNLGEYSLEVIR